MWLIRSIYSSHTGWRENEGWMNLSAASRYSSSQKKKKKLPEGGEWVSETYLREESKPPSLEERVATLEKQVKELMER